MTERTNKRKLTDVVCREALRTLGFVRRSRKVKLEQPSSDDMAVRPQEKEAETKKVPQS